MLAAPDKLGDDYTLEEWTKLDINLRLKIRAYEWAQGKRIAIAYKEKTNVESKYLQIALLKEEQLKGFVFPYQTVIGVKDAQEKIAASTHVLHKEDCMKVLSFASQYGLK